ncbi:uncharacterized protein JCM6883_004848 [Sporobolomyces salmoneus]|uniref:uncharacterized protein n=1 Tax=Sporobolomyces salmoneus TaxID=183962 RepID=UPI003180F9A8
MEVSLIHSPLIGYFAAIGGLLYLVLPQLLLSNQTRGSLLFLALSVLSLLTTWTYMFKYFQHSFKEAAFERGIAMADFSTREWLEDVSLFNEAWGYVCQTAGRYWWSEQLMYWTTGPLAMLMSVEGRRRGVKHIWAYMLIGQIVAISFAQSLFFAALALTTQIKPRAPIAGRPLGPPPGQTWALLFSVVLGAIGTTTVPSQISTPYFLPILLGVHLCSLLPLLDFIPQRLVRLPPSRLYFNYAFIALRLRWETISQLIDFSKLTSKPKQSPEILSTFFQNEWKVLNEHPAQSSISWDVIFTSVSAVAFMLYDNVTQEEAELKVPYELVVLFTLATPLVGVQSTIGMYLAVREGKRESFEQKQMWEAEDDKEKKKE